MKKLSKILALMLAMITAISAFSLSGYAVATPLEAGSSMETAANVPEYGVAYVSEISVPSESNWFKFTTVSDAAYYTVSMTLYSLPGDPYGPHIYLYDANLKQIDDLLCVSSAITNKKLETNSTYYIKVCNRPDNGRYDEGDVGNYEIKVSYTKDIDDDSMNYATEIQVNNAYNRSMDGWGDYDYFKFTAPISAEYVFTAKNYNINTDGYMLNFALKDEYSQTMGSCKCPKGEQRSFKITLEKDHVYYIESYMGSYRWKETGNYEFSVNCETMKSLVGISVVSSPEKTTYAIGDTLDTTGLKIKAEYSDGTSKIISTGFTVNCAAFIKRGTYAVTVSYTEDAVTETCTFNVAVKEAIILQSISVYSTPDKTTYETGDELDISGLVVKANYSDGTSKTVTNYTLGSFDSSTAGTKTILVSYTENGVTETAAFTVEVEEAEEEPVSTGGFFESILMKILGFFTMIIDAITSILS